MKPSHAVQRLVVTALLLAALVACGKKEPPAPAPAPAPAPVAAPALPPAAPVVEAQTAAAVQVASIDVHSQANPTRLATGAPAVFAASDTIDAVVSTTGSATSATLAAKWTFQDGQVVDESSQTIAPTGPAATTFTIAKPDGWPTGKYKVEITLDGQAAGSSEFEVK
jgi:hypothetical protein